MRKYTYVSRLLMGIAIAGAGIYALSQSYQSTNWPTTKATVIESDLLTPEADTSELKLAVKYKYRLGGKSYTDEKVMSSSRMAGFFRGNGVSVHYNPNDPEETAIETGLPIFTCVTVVAGLLMCGHASFDLLTMDEKREETFQEMNDQMIVEDWAI